MAAPAALAEVFEDDACTLTNASSTPAAAHQRLTSRWARIIVVGSATTGSVESDPCHPLSRRLHHSGDVVVLRLPVGVIFRSK